LAIFNVVPLLLHLLGAAAPQSDKVYLWVKVFVDENGVPLKVDALHLVPRTTMRAAEKQMHAETVRSWRFKPKLSRGNRVPHVRKFPIEVTPPIVVKKIGA
jgi:hypothetical protein